MRDTDAGFESVTLNPGFFEAPTSTLLRKLWVLFKKTTILNSFYQEKW